MSSKRSTNLFTSGQRSMQLLPCETEATYHKFLEKWKSTNYMETNTFPYISSPKDDEISLFKDCISKEVKLLDPLPSAYIMALQPDETLWLALQLYGQMRNMLSVAIDSIDDLKQQIAINRPSYVTVVAYASQLDDSTLWEIEELFWNETQSRSLEKPFHPSIYVARDIASLSRLMVKTFLVEAEPAQKHLQLMPFFEEWPGKQHPAFLEIIQGEHAHAQYLLERTATPVNILSIIGHGTDDATYLGPDIICGASHAGHSSLNGFQKPRGLPICYQTGHCFKAATIINARTLPCQVVFANMCMGLKLKDMIFDPAYSLCLNFLDGWAAAYISTPTNREAWLFENLLFQYLCLEAGYTAGEALSLVNLMMYTTTGESSRLILAGDATLRISNAAHCSPPTVEITNQEDGTWRVVLERLGCLAWASIYHQALWQAAKEGHAYIQQIYTGQEEAPVDTTYFGIIPTSKQGEVLLLLFSTSELPQERLTVALTTVPPIDAIDQRRLRTALKCLSPDYPVKLVQEKMYEDKLKQVQLARTKLAQILPNVQFVVKDYERSLKIKRKIMNQLLSIESLIVSEVANRTEKGGFVGWDAYDFGRPFKALKSFERLVDAKECSVCGGPILRKISAYQADTEIQRQIDFCSHCGVQRDAPLENGLEISIQGSDHFRVGTTIKQVVRLHNTGTETSCGSLSVRVGKSWHYRLQLRPEVQTYSLAPGEANEYAFEADFDDKIPPHVHFVKAIVLDNFELVYSSRPIWVNLSSYND